LKATEVHKSEETRLGNTEKCVLSSSTSCQYYFYLFIYLFILLLCCSCMCVMFPKRTNRLFSWKLLWTSCHWRSPHIHNFNYLIPIILIWRSCELLRWVLQ